MNRFIDNELFYFFIIILILIRNMLLFFKDLWVRGGFGAAFESFMA
jgi:hypothetical protein